MARTDFTEANGYILEEQGSNVIQDLIANSAVERFARRENMASRTKTVPRFVSDAPQLTQQLSALLVVKTWHHAQRLYHVSCQTLHR